MVLTVIRLMHAGVHSEEGGPLGKKVLNNSTLV